MKNNSCAFYLFLVSALLQVSNNVIALESDGGEAREMSVTRSKSHTSSSSSSTVTQANSLVLSKKSDNAVSRDTLSTQARYLKLRNFVARSQQISNKNRAFLGMLAIACSIWANDKETALLTAIKYFMAFKGVEWCLISFDGWMSQAANVLVYTGDQPSNVAQNRLRSLPGQRYELNLEEVDILTGKPFAVLISESDFVNEPYIAAELTNGSKRHSQCNYVDARTLHSSIHTKSSFLSDLLRENDENVYPFTISFPSQVASNDIIDIHYFELTQEGNFVSLGTIYDMDDPNKQDTKQKLLTTFVGMLSKEECDQELVNLASKIEDGKCFNNSQKDLNCSKAIILLEAMLKRVKQNNKSNPLDNNVLLATLSLANVYKINGEFELAKQTLNTVPGFALLQKMCKLNNMLDQSK